MAFIVPAFDTLEEVEEYYRSCFAYWTRRGDPSSVAACKAFWWDCVEVWTAAASWNPAKESFAMQRRGYTPGAPVPEASRVEAGNA